MTEQFQQVGVDVFDLRERLPVDDELFLQWLLVDNIQGETPDFHLEGFSIMCDLNVKRSVFAWPRGHAKTTLAKAAVCKLFLHTDVSFIVYVSNTATLAVNICVDIIGLLESPNCRRVYGTPNFRVKQDGVGFYRFTLGGKDCVLLALGSGQQIRGMNIGHERPQVAFCDDLESAEDLQTESGYTRMRTWFYGSFRKALDGKIDKINQIGNMIKSRSILSDHCKSEHWLSRVYGAIRSDGTPLWPQLYTIERLQSEYLEYMEVGEIATWFAELMNIVINVVSGLIKPEQITYEPQPLPGHGDPAVITVDMAYSRQAWANKTAVFVHVYSDGAWREAEWVAKQGMQIDELISQLVTYSLRWNVRVIGIESVAFSAVYEPTIKWHLRRENLDHIHLVPLQATSQKTQRLAAWCGMLATAQYILRSGVYALTKQLLEYDPTAKQNDDDAIDAAAHIVQLLNRYGAMIFANEQAKPHAAINPGGLSLARLTERHTNGLHQLSERHATIQARGNRTEEDTYEFRPLAAE